MGDYYLSNDAKHVEHERAHQWTRMSPTLQPIDTKQKHYPLIKEKPLASKVSLQPTIWENLQVHIAFPHHDVEGAPSIHIRWESLPDWLTNSQVASSMPLLCLQAYVSPRWFFFLGTQEGFRLSYQSRKSARFEAEVKGKRQKTRCVDAEIEIGLVYYVVLRRELLQNRQNGSNKERKKERKRKVMPIYTTN